ncbi:MAG: C-terminal binding protein [Desulfobacterales bacterium]|nr:MAG: C-terminal binding protein [Desulfobacterales bacterium]
MAKYKVVVVSLGYETYDYEREILKPIDAELILSPRDCTTESEVIEVARDADAIFVRETPITAKALESFERCKIVSRYGVGLDNIDLDAAKKLRIYVSNVPEYGTEDVSDHAVALLLGCIRTILVRDRNLRQGNFESDICDEIYRTTGKNLGIIGYGKIARAFHRKWMGFLPARVLVYDPFVAEDVIRENGAEKVDLDTLLSESDFISLHTPLTLETRHIINEAVLKKMKNTAILVNTSRGGAIDTDALVNALQEGQILRAGLDVFENEPLPTDHPLIEMDNVILTSHVAWYSKDSAKDLQTGAAKEVLRVLSGDKPVNWVNPW